MGKKYANLIIDKNFIISSVDKRLFGSLIEHLGRAVYTGIYQPDHPSADEQGFRQDVLKYIQDLNVSIVRYPGGSCVSNFFWEDSVGPVNQRPRRLDLAWTSIEPNWVGLHEFDQWRKKAGAEVMMTLNLGTRGVADACNLLEYCNMPTGTKYSNLRVQHGCAQPYGFKIWCLGNEMDASWTLGAKTAQEYGRLVCETAKAMKLMDPTIELVCCGSSHNEMETFPKWEAEALLHSYDYVEYISLHKYFGNRDGDTKNFLAMSMEMDSYIDTVVSTCNYVKARKRGKKNIYLSFDEWNVWFHSNAADDEFRKKHPWQIAPPLLEDRYTFEDALLVGLMLISLLRHADRVKIACLAQLVNVIAPIMTEKDGGVWRQTIYWPFLHASRYGRGIVLQPVLQSSRHSTKDYTDVNDVESVAVWNEELEELTVFAVNRDLDERVEFTCDIRSFPDCVLLKHIILTSEDLQTTNGPGVERVAPVEADSTPMDGGVFRTHLVPASWNVIRFSTSKH